MADGENPCIAVNQAKLLLLGIMRGHRHGRVLEDLSAICDGDIEFDLQEQSSQLRSGCSPSAVRPLTSVTVTSDPCGYLRHRTWISALPSQITCFGGSA